MMNAYLLFCLHDYNRIEYISRSVDCTLTLNKLY